MDKASPPDIVAEARKLTAAGERWHFHVLNPACHYAQSVSLFSIILENEATGLVSRALFPEKPLAVAHELAKLQYGSAFKEVPAGTVSTPVIKAIEEAIRVSEERGVDWHHHHLYPTCCFNPNAGKHVIVLETPVSAQILSAVYDDHPGPDLSLIERLYYRGL